MIDDLDRAGDAVVLAPAAEPTPVATLQRRATRRHRRRLVVSVAAPVCALVLAVAVAANAVDGSKHGAVTVVAPSTTLGPVPTSVAAVVSPTTAASAAGTTTTLPPASATTAVTAHPPAPVTTVPSTLPKNGGGDGLRGSGGGSGDNGPVSIVTPDVLVTARSLYAQRGSADYDFDLMFGWSITQPQDGAGYRITVRNGAITHTSPLGHSVGLGVSTPPPATIEQLFDQIQSTVEGSSDVMVAGRFDPQFGFPATMQFFTHVSGIHRGEAFAITSWSPAGSPAG
jgi:hypothetical protein